MASRKNKPIDKKYCEMVIEAAKQMAGRALTVATWGNISIRDPETGHIYVTPSGMDYDKSTPEDVVAFNSDGIRILRSAKADHRERFTYRVVSGER